MNNPVSIALEEIRTSLGVIEDECDNHGAWAASDDEAKLAMHLGMELLSMGFSVGHYGRDHAEGGPAPGWLHTPASLTKEA